MWLGETVSVVLMTYDERDSIREVIDDFFATGVVDEVLVVNNNSREGTAEQAELTDARQVFEAQQGYGHAVSRGLRDAEGDLIVLAEPDGTFLAKDIIKLLAYSTDCDVVLGTRTTREMIWDGGQHGLVPEVGELGCRQAGRDPFQHESPERRWLHLSADAQGRGPLDVRDDVGRRQPRRPGDDAARDHVGTSPGRGAGQLSARVGTSSVTGHPVKAVLLGLRMIAFILATRFGRNGRVA